MRNAVDSAGILTVGEQNSNSGRWGANSAVPLQSLSRLQDLSGVGGLSVGNQPVDSDPIIGAGHPNMAFVGSANRPRRRVAWPPREDGLYEGDLLVSHSRPRVSPRRWKWGVVGRPHEVDNLAGRARPGQPAVLRRSFAKVLTTTEVLHDGGDRLRVLRRRLQQFSDQLHSELDALRAYRESSVRLFNVEQRLVSDCSGVNPRQHPMQCHSVTALSAVNRPARRIQSRVARQRAGMQIEAPPTRRRDNFRLDDEQ